MDLFEYYVKMRESDSKIKKFMIEWYLPSLDGIPKYILFTDHNLEFPFILDKAQRTKIKNPRGAELYFQSIRDRDVCFPVIDGKSYIALKKQEDFNIDEYMPGEHRTVEYFLDIDDFVFHQTGDETPRIRKEYMDMALYSSLEEANAKYKSHPLFDSFWEDQVTESLAMTERDGYTIIHPSQFNR